MRCTDTLRAFLHNLECPAVIMGGAADHIHLLGNESRTIALAEWVKELKRASSHWAKKRAAMEPVSIAGGLTAVFG